MRKVYLLIYVITGILMCGCSDELSYYEGRRPSLERNYLHFDIDRWKLSLKDCEETTIVGTVKSSHPWSFQGLPDWLIVTPDKGEANEELGTKVELTMAENETMMSRVSVFSLQSVASDYTYQVDLTASQPAGEMYATLEDGTTLMHIDAKKQTLAIKIRTNIPDPYVEFSETWGKVTWNAVSQIIDLEVEFWNSANRRTGAIYISSDEERQSGDSYKKVGIHIIQDAAQVECGEPMYFLAEGGTKTQTIHSDAAWTIKTDASWVSVSPESGDAGETEIRVSVLPTSVTYDRSASVRFYINDSEKDYFTVEQDGLRMEVSPYTININADGVADSDITIDSNVSWQLASKPEWVIINPEKGPKGETSISVAAQKNNSLNTRSGEIEFTDFDTGGITRTVTVGQSALDIGEDVTMEFGWQASSRSLDIPLPNNWQTMVSDGWITLSDYMGTGQKTIEVSVSKNDSEEARRGTITITSEGKTFDVMVVQKGQFIHIDTPASTVGAMGGVINLQVSATMAVVPSIEYDGEVTGWITYDDAGDNNYNITIAYNPSGIDRTATFVLTTTETDVADTWSAGVKMKITQLGRQLSCDVAEIVSFAKGGTTDIYTITAEGDYKISKSADSTWFSLIHDEENSKFYLAVTENKTDSERKGQIVISLSNLPESEEKKLIIEVSQRSIYDDEILWQDYEDEQDL